MNFYNYVESLLKQNKRSVGDGIKMILEHRSTPTGLLFHFAKS